MRSILKLIIFFFKNLNVVESNSHIPSGTHQTFKKLKHLFLHKIPEFLGTHITSCILPKSNLFFQSFQFLVIRIIHCFKLNFKNSIINSWFLREVWLNNWEGAICNPQVMQPVVHGYVACNISSH